MNAAAVLQTAVTPPEQQGKLHTLLERLIGRLDEEVGMLARVQEDLGYIGAAIGTEKPG